MRSLVGRLVGMDFADRRVRLFYPPAQRFLEGSYAAELEERLFEHRGGLVKVIGDITVDAEGLPEGIGEVSEIEEMDLTPIEVNSFEAAGRRVVLRRPLILNPEVDPSRHFLLLRDERIGIDVFAASREELLEELEDNLRMLWLDYALADPASLDAAAQRLRDHWLTVIAA